MPMVPLFGVGDKKRSSNVVSQTRVNMYVESSDDKSQMVLYSRPGLIEMAPATLIITGSGTGPALGAAVMAYSNGPGVVGYPVIEYLWRGYQGGFVRLESATKGIGTTPSATEVGPSNRVSFAYNGMRGFAVDGNAAWWISPNGLSAPQALPADDFNWSGATSVCFLAGRFVINYPTYPGRFYWSGLNAALFDPWEALDYATAESSPDPLVAVTDYRGELVLWGTTTIEFWAPDASTTFANISGSTAAWGLVAQWSVQKLGEGCYFVGRQATGRPQVCRLRGYQVEVVSTPDIDSIIDDEGDAASDSLAWAMAFGGHEFYGLNLTNKTIVYDATTGSWAEWQTDGGRWCGQYVVSAWGKLLVTDYRSDTLYEVDADTYKDGDAPMLREVTSRHVFKDLHRLTAWELALDVETGVGISTGQGSDPRIMLQVSKDGGHTFGAELWAALGRLGEYVTRVVWRRLGRGRDFVFRFRVADPVKVVLIGASMRAEE
jgi:hypothetical protein